MPSRPWSGYGRFCPLSRALDVIGERWTLVIVQELLKQPRRYGALLDQLPGISTSVRGNWSSSWADNIAWRLCHDGTHQR